MLILKQFGQLILAVLHPFPDLLQSLLLPLDDSHAQLLDLHEVGAKVLAEALLEAVYPILGEDIFLDGLVLILERVVVLGLVGEFRNEELLDLAQLFCCL